MSGADTFVRPEYSGDIELPYRVSIVSRCSWTLYNFRRGLLRSISAAGGTAIAFGGCGDGYERRLKTEGFDIRHIPVSRAGVNPVRDAQLLLVLCRHFRRVRPDIVHSFTIKPSIYATLAAAFSGVPVRIVTITGLGHAFTSAGFFLRTLVGLLYRIALARADVVFFQNKDDRNLFVAHGLVNARSARLINGSGVDLEHYRLTPLPSQHGGPLRFLMVSRLLKEKGIREYISAAELLKRTYPTIQFGLVGGRDNRNPTSLSVEELEILRESNAVDWTDEVEDIRPVIRAADVVVLPSYREGLSRSLLEAGAMGRALIATDVPGCREVVRHEWNGYLVPPANPDALACAMERLILAPESIAIFGSRSRALVQAKYDERSVVIETLHTYVELIDRKVGPKATQPFVTR